MIAYWVLVIAGVAAMVLFREHARRVFWACMIVFAGLAIYHYREIETGKWAVRGALRERFWSWAFADLSSPLVEASRETAAELAMSLPLHWWEDNSPRYALREIVTNQWLLAVDEQKCAARIALGEQKKKSKPRQPAEIWQMVSITANVAGASIEIDGQPLGETPAEIQLVPGEYEVHISKVGWGEWSDKVAVRPGSDPRITIQFAGAGESPVVTIVW